MRYLLALLALSTTMFAQALKPLQADDAVRIAEFYRLATQIQDRIWLGWSKTPAPLLLVTSDTEYLTHDVSPPKEFQRVGDDTYARPRQFSPNMQATFPAFG
ncbi:MAG TPA: hypothetical protein VII29_02935, partial [Terriglobales bacterium]